MRDLTWVRPFLTLVRGVVVAVLPVSLSAQSFQQIYIGEGPTWRLTEGWTQSQWELRLFGGAVRIATYVNFPTTGKSYQFVVDPVWNRVLYGKEGSWSKAWINSNGPGGVLYRPVGAAISQSGTLFVADSWNSRVLIALFNGENISSAVGSFGLDNAVVSAVAWDGELAPAIVENVYLADEAQSRVAYFRNENQSGTWVLAWTYGSRGSGAGQFLSPRGICVGHSASSPSGGTQFSKNFYVVDAGNRRLVWLERSLVNENDPPVWKQVASLPEGWEPAGCTVDHFGIVYVADKQNHQLVSYTWSLQQLTRYGRYGTGANNYNTFAYPHDVHIPFGRKVVNGQTIWYGDGRILTAEQWGPGSGGLEHWLGVEISSATAWGGGWESSVDFHLTQYAYVTVQVSPGTHSPGDPIYRTLWASYLTPPGWHSEVWDGTGPSGNPAPEGSYHFHVSAVSAYGCSGQPFCTASRGTNSFYWQPCEDPELIECNPPVNVALPLGGDPIIAALPTSYRLGQVIADYAGPLLRMEGLGGAGALPAGLSSAEAVASVRAHGIRALAVEVPGGAERNQVTVRLYALTGRLVRILVDEAVEPGAYVVGWDGRDASGRPAQPGVYVAVMTAGTYRGVQRLLLK